MDHMGLVLSTPRLREHSPSELTSTHPLPRLGCDLHDGTGAKTTRRKRLPGTRGVVPRGAARVAALWRPQGTVDRWPLLDRADHGPGVALPCSAQAGARLCLRG